MDELNILAWNVRGLNHPLKKSELTRLVSSNNVCIGAAFETRVRSVNWDKFLRFWLSIWGFNLLII